MAGVIKASLNVDGNWPVIDSERLNNSHRNGAISAVTDFITETGNRSATELLSRTCNMVEVTSPTLTGEKDVKDAPCRTPEKYGSGAPAVFDLTALTLSEKYRLKSSTLMAELADGHPRPRSWLIDLQSLLGDSRSVSTVSHQNAVRLD